VRHQARLVRLRAAGSSVVTIAMPTLAPMLRIRLKMPEPWPICSRLRVPMAIVVNGTKIRGPANPFRRLVQTTPRVSRLMRL
jgi:hypothetical protein